MKRLFGTDGIRGVAGTFPLDKTTINYIGLALGESLIKSGKAGRVIVGRDTRESGQWITESLINSLIQSGIDSVHEVGIITTPGLAFLARFHQFDLGIMVSASHNQFRDNGIKAFSKDGFKLSDELEHEIEKRVYELMESSKPAAPQNRDCYFRRYELIQDYASFLLSHFKGNLNSYRIGLDVCNGSAYSIAPQIFSELGASVKLINHNPDGKNINQNCGSLHLEGLKTLVKESKLAFGVAFDGDADRSLFVTPLGKIFDGDHTLYAFSRYLKQTGELRSSKVVGTIMSNLALEIALQRESLQLIRAAVGDKYVLEEMESTGANLGGEPSGHVILRDYHTTGDGILTAVKLAEILCKEHAGLDELAGGFDPYPQILEGLRIRRKIPIKDSPEILQIIKKAEGQLGELGRIVVRYSGTEPVLRIMAEGENREQVEALVRQLKSDLESAFSRYEGD